MTANKTVQNAQPLIFLISASVPQDTEMPAITFHLRVLERHQEGMRTRASARVTGPCDALRRKHLAGQKWIRGNPFDARHDLRHSADRAGPSRGSSGYPKAGRED